MKRRWALAVLAALILCAAVFGRLALAERPWVAVARQYTERALEYDYLGIYGLFDPAVLDRELERYGMDRADMEARAEENRRLIEASVDNALSPLGVTAEHTWALLAEREVTGDELAFIRANYADDGFDVDVRRARDVTFLVTTCLTREGEQARGEEELTVTVIRTASGWWLDRGSVNAVESVIHALPALARQHFGT